MRTRIGNALVGAVIGLGMAATSYANCNSKQVVDEVLDVAAIIGTVSTAVNVSQAVIRPLADMWGNKACQEQLGISAEEARVIAQEVVVSQERRNIQETINRARSIMQDYNQQCAIGRDSACLNFVVEHALSDAGDLASAEDNAIAHGFLLADTMEALVANRLSLLTLWAKAKIEQNEQTQVLSEEDLKGQIKSVFQNRLGLSYSRMVQMVQNYQQNIGWVLDRETPIYSNPTRKITGEKKRNRYCWNFGSKSGCSAVRDSRNKARRQAYSRRLDALEFDLELRDRYFGATYRSLLTTISHATDGFDSYYDHIRN
ncbi:hypothetical protein [Pseudobacteriovorax antillogorgiicola]|uniref:Uncharacterized protein n=1 Tax=Pseudobacteriovorax antillogorgiicola TaxID=1513793 RepID=A0A1Y6CWP3_9BACT|nr:hypothetical protein [Pseudobacteriovorax antillogorgiicola]TCS42735.1 hypothetical protein EDD56_1403 [Pseudobacteriovorax antillogorgiicola]SMF82170.1 hypothetical protein SAMN06296036_1403 [Pseudobacteriovorax antillogorgiicola]